jgi:NADPH:quinone reductase-like Zn-dependent oxidoreductase
MKTEAVVLRTHGGPEVLVRETIDLPDPGPREVRVRVRAVALNHLDLWVRRGLPNLKLEYPHRLGCDIVGEVDALGPGARTALKPGDKVVVSPGVSCGVCERCLSGQDNLCRQYAILGEHTSGGYSRHVVVPDANLLPYPVGGGAPTDSGTAELSFTDVAAVPLVFLTAWQMVVDKARVRPGQTVLVQAAGSGVSSAAIQIAKLFGARVIATTGTDAKAERARALGADAVVNYATQDFVAEVKKLTGKRGADVVIEHVGGEVMSKSVVATAAGGRIVTCGATAGFTPSIDLRHVFFRQIEILGSTMGSKGSLFGILEHVAAGRLRPVVDRVLPLWDATEAHRVLEARQAFGKVVLAVD